MLDLIIACVAGVFISMILIVLVKLVRANFPVRVTCWFCDKSIRVPVGNRNCWDCPSCEQYNGFTSDGDYNKPIPAQWSTEMNHPVPCEKQEFIQSTNGLCPACNERQLLKMQQLMVFKPFVESNYSREVNDYKEHLEKIYHLCYKCNLYVHQELERQDLALKLRHSSSQHLSNESLLSSQASSSTPPSSLSDVFPVVRTCGWANQWCSHLMGVVSCLLAAFLLFVHLGQMQTGFVYKMQLPTWALDLLGWLTTKNCGIAFSGLFLCLTSKFLWVGQKSLYPSDVVCCFIWLVQSLLSVLTTFGLVSTLYLPMVQSATPFVSLLSIFLTIFSSVAQRSTVSNEQYSSPSNSQSSNSSSLQTSFGSPEAEESVRDFDCNESLSSWHTSKTKLTSQSKLDSSFSSPSYHKPFLRHRPSSTSFSPTRDPWSPFSLKANFLAFPLGHDSNLPSFKSVSQASLNGGFASPKSLYSRPLSRSSSYFSLDKTSSSQCGPRSLNGSFSSLKPGRKSTPSSLAENILGIKMNKISLGSSGSHSRRSMSDANLFHKSLHNSPSPVLSRGEIAPARFSTFKSETDHLSSNRIFSDHRDSLFGCSNYQNYLNDTASVHSDNFSVRSCSSRKSRQFIGDTSFSPNTSHLTSDTNQSEVNDNDDSRGYSPYTANYSSGVHSKNTGSKRCTASLLIISVCINILLIALYMERVPLPLSISTHLSPTIVSFKQFVSSSSTVIVAYLSSLRTDIASYVSSLSSRWFQV